MMFLCFGGRSVQQEEMIHEFSTSLWFQVKVRKKKLFSFLFLDLISLSFPGRMVQDGGTARSLSQSLTQCESY